MANVPDPRAAVRNLVRRARRLAGNPARDPALPPTDWVRAEPQPDAPDPVAPFRLFAVLGTWYEADVVEATVRNAFTQGCERVLLVDNDSPDDTVSRAEAAGAELARTYATGTYDESLRMALMNEVVAEVSEATAAADGTEHVWWLWLDADEFHHGSRGRTVREHLATLDRRFRVVGARFFNHYPDAVPEYVEGRHPLDFQPLCEEHVYPMCALGHRKHPLQRWDRGGPPITCAAGFHQASLEGGQLVEPLDPVFLHHFPFRVEQVSRRRLEALCATDGRGEGTPRAADRKVHVHIHNRFTSFDAVYRHDWGHVENLLPGHEHRGISLAPWEHQVPVADHPVARWY